MTWNKVWAVGKDTYIRVYPNPGFGIQFTDYKRFAFSWRGGFEWFQWIWAPANEAKKREAFGYWQRYRAYFSRVKRPGGKG